MDKKEMYRSIIVSRTSKPYNFLENIPNGYLEIKANISSCQDDFNIYVKINNSNIEDIKFNGQGCSISTASLDMLSEYLSGLTKVEALKFIENYKAMIKGEKCDTSKLKDLICMENISNHLNRVGCALIGANSIKLILGGKNE